MSLWSALKEKYRELWKSKRRPVIRLLAVPDGLQCKDLYCPFPDKNSQIVSLFYLQSPYFLSCHYQIPDNHLSVLHLFVIQEYYVNGIIQQVTFWDWLFVLSVISLRSVQVVCVAIHSFLLLGSIPWCECTIVWLTIHLWVTYGSFPGSAVKRKAATSNCLKVLMWP